MNALSKYAVSHVVQLQEDAKAEVVADLYSVRLGLKGQPTAEEFRQLTLDHKGVFTDVNPFDGRDHGYIELGGWLGDQATAFAYMGLGVLLGLFDVLTPQTMLPTMPKSIKDQMAGAGYITILAR